MIMLLARLARRQRQPEIMDNPDLDPVQHVRALRGLARINRLSASAAILWSPLRDLATAHANRPLRVLDIGTGGGDVPISLWRRACRTGLAIELCGIDISATAIEQARRNAQAAGAYVDFHQLDALHDDLPANFDAVTSALFLHHLDEAQALTLLSRMGQATRSLVLVNDLMRSRLGYLAAWVGTRLLTTCPVVHVDGPRSVEGAFTVAEAHDLAARAGLQGAAITRHWPWRYLLTWRKPA
jgi:2-polyprenyl-3-methyl-5-hydroxy-6-metoxy-1,4-benzoquinol methylase